MESVKKWGHNSEVIKKNGLYVHYSLPKVVSSLQLRQWAREGATRRLERMILMGQGGRLLAAADAVPLSRRLQDLVRKCSALHTAVERGSLMELQELLKPDCHRKKYVTCLDEAGVGLLHKAIYYSYLDIAEWLVQNFPHLVHLRDSEGRTALHYTAACKEEATAAELLERAGAKRDARDGAGRLLAHYRAARIPLTLPDVAAAMPARPNATGLVIKRHNIRIWCHECDMGRLQRVVWEGHGARLLSEVSSQPVVKKFLEAVPYLMNTIRDIHNAVIQNDLEGLMKLTADPVPPQALSSRDVNNMTVMHKAAGLGHGGIMKYIIERYPQGINDVDNDGRTPLHYAATFKDEQHTYNTLVAAGADESVVDNKNRTPGYYITRSQEIDKTIFHTLPDAPRTPSSVYPSSWDWKILGSDFTADLNKKSRKKNLKASNENISSKKTTTDTVSETLENQATAMKGSSTHELISDLPELDDTEKTQIENTNNKEIHESEDNQNTIDNDVHEAKEKEESVCENVETTQTTTAEDADGNEIKDENEMQNKNVDKSTKVGNEAEINQKDTDKNIQIQSEEETASEQKVQNQPHTSDVGNEDEVEKPEENHEQNKKRDTGKVTENGNELNVTESQQQIETNGKNEINDNKNREDESGQALHKSEKDEITNENIEETTVNNNSNTDLKEDSKEEDEKETETKDGEGNYNSDHNEDDDDVQVQKDCHSEYSDDHDTDNLGIAENCTSTRGNPNLGRNNHESLIEGIISGEAEQDSQDASMNHRGETVEGDLLIVDNEIDPEVTELINTANMEMLATLVLNGEGSRLIGRHTQNAELQAFLDNVPTYMQKINKVHLAAKEGNIRDLQAALDRRKFVIARDPVSPNGATPLHVATVFGKTNIIKYLGGRFPETLSAVDFEGRTALHYGAVLPDNGHYYNLLQQLGANSKDLDDNGISAEDYYKNSSLLPFNQLLVDFGISEEAAKNMLSDKVWTVPRDRVSSRRILDTPEALDTLERCYRLLASARPSRTPLSASSNKATPPLVLGRFLKQPVFEMIKHRITKLDHDLFDVIWPAVKKLPDNRNLIQTVEEDFPGGVTAPDFYVYEVFAEFMLPVVKDLHNINVNFELPAHPMSDFLTNSTITSITTSDPLIELNIDPNNEFVLSGAIECSRNLSGFEFPLNLKIGKLENIERILTTILMQENFAKIIEQINPESDQKGGSYYTLNEVLEKPSEICAALASSGLLIALCDRDEIDDCTRLHGKHWPYGRGVYVSDDKTLAIWINVQDHLRVLISTPTDSPGEIGLPFSKLTYIMSYLHAKLDFVWDVNLGHLSSRPTFLGAGLRFNLIINFPGLSKDPDNMKHLCAMRGLQYRETLSTNIARVSNYQCLNMTETNCFNDYATAVSNLLHLEKDLSMQNSAHIAAMLTNIFKRKRSSLADLDSSAEEIPGKH